MIVVGAYNMSAWAFSLAVNDDDTDDDDWDSDGIEPEDPCDFCGCHYTATGRSGTCESCSLTMCHDCFRCHP